MDDCFCIENFFSESDMQYLESVIDKAGPGTVQMGSGPFEGKKIATHISLINDAKASQFVLEKISKVVPESFSLTTFKNTILYLPWDVHSDFYLNECKPGNRPHYNFLIPLDNVPSRTIVFNEFTDGNRHFYAYKEKNKPVENPVNEQFWNENLSMCWPHDREYLSIRKIMPYQKRGQLVAFGSQYFHSSDNFHTRFSEPKKFILIRTERPSLTNV